MTLHFLVNGQEYIPTQHKTLLLNHRKIYAGEHMFSSG